jgi:hypothetical protein
MDRPRDRDRVRRFAPGIEALECRKVLSFFAPISSYSLFSSGSYGSSSQQLSAQAAVVRHEYDQYVGELKTIELKSQATPAEFLTLRDDARAISVAASAANLPAAAANETAAEVSLQLDRAPLYGAAKDPGWAVVSARVTTNLDSLDVPQPLIDQTLADMKSLANSANVSPGEFQTFTNDFNTLRAGEGSLPSNPYYHFEDPGLYYSQHLRGFFRHWGTQKVAAEAKLQGDLRAISSVTHAGPAGVAVLHRDVHLLESLGAVVPSTTNAQLDDAYLAVFAEGVPASQGISQLRSNLVTILGPVATAPRIASINRLVADAPAFAQAAGNSPSAIEMIVTDVGAVVDAGGGDTLNPFNVTVRHASPANHAG